MQKTRELLSLVLIALLPFHALLVTVGTKLVAGPGQAPMAEFALWKEAVLGVVLLLAGVEWLKKRVIKLDALDAIVIAMLLLSIGVTALTHGDWKLYALGFKYDFVPLVAFVLLRRVAWSDAFKRKAFATVLIAGGISAAYAITTFWLPASFFYRLGYSDLLSLYNPDGPVAAFQNIESLGVRRVQGAMSGPNQLGLWLLLPWAVALVRKHYAVAVVVFTAILLTFSRSAWIASGVILLLVLWQSLPKKVFWSALAGVCGASLVAGVTLLSYAPGVITRGTSTLHHLQRPLEAVQTLVQHPLGLGLGMAGPASNRVSDTCVHLPEGSDASWATDRPTLCVFVGDVQVQPEAPCSCPLLPENWYLQIGIEMGVLGMVLFITLIVLLLGKLKYNRALQLACIGISLAALFLHSWESAAVAYSLWLLAAASVAE